MSLRPAVLITGASTGIGATYAERFAHRGHDLVLVSRNEARMTELATRLRNETGVTIEILPADLTCDDDLVRIEARLSADARIGVLVNNAGTAIPGGFAKHGSDKLGKLLALNVTAVARLAHAAAPRMAAAGKGAIVNISSVIGLAPEIGSTLYGATKSFVLFLSQSLNLELAPSGVYVQAVLPAATRTEIWTHIGRDVNSMVGVMEVEALVDAALVGFDRREAVTIPPLPDDEQWRAFEAACRAMLPNFSRSQPAARYRQAV